MKELFYTLAAARAEQATPEAIQAGVAAREILIEMNTGLVVSIARRYIGRSTIFDIEDLVNEGVIGLMTAIDRFDPDRAERFSTYATFWIKKAIRQALIAHGSTIRLPERLQAQTFKVLQALDALRIRLGREPSVAEIAAATGCTDEQVRECFAAASAQPLSFDTPIDEDIVLGDAISAPEPTREVTRRNAAHRILQCLEPREAHVLIARSESQTLAQIGDALGCTRQRVQQLEARALKKVRGVLAQGGSHV